jgi:beta-lactamase superfamily II metal-dependent hydrolase
VSAGFELTMLPAEEGDCLLLTYDGTGRRHRVLVDGGRKRTAKVLAATLGSLDLTAEERVFELLIITHVDRDHIEGILAFLEDDCPVTFRDIWFNGYHHLQDSSVERFGAVQGERLSAWLQTPGTPWNNSFGGGPVVVGTPTVQLGGGCQMSVLAPDQGQLRALAPLWQRECEKAGIIAGRAPEPEPVPEGLERMGAMTIADLAVTRFHPDRKEPNGSTIVVLVEYSGRRVLLGGDAHVSRLVQSIAPMAEAEGGRFRLAALKVPHHGSAGNMSNELLDLLDCPRYLISTNGSYFNHPDPEAIARIISHGGSNPEIIFNYRPKESRIWDEPTWRHERHYGITYPSKSVNGTISVDLSS